MKLNYQLTGVTNGKYLEVKGEGKINLETGGYNLNLHSIIAPNGWDPGIIIMICCDNLRLFSSKPKNENREDFRKNMLPLVIGNSKDLIRSGFIMDKDGEYVVGTKAKGFLFQEGDTIFSRSVILEGFSHLDKFGGIKKIFDYEEKITPTISNTAIGLSKYSIETNDNTSLEGYTDYPYKFNNLNLKEDLTLKMSDIQSGYNDFHKSKFKETTISVTVQEL